MRKLKPVGKPLLVLLVKRTSIFLFACCALVAYLYGVGTFQGFLDSTQLFLLDLLSTGGLLLGVSSVYGAVLAAWEIFGRKKPSYAAAVAGYAFLASCGAAFALFASFVLALSAGKPA